MSTEAPRILSQLQILTDFTNRSTRALEFFSCMSAVLASSTTDGRYAGAATYAVLNHEMKLVAVSPLSAIVLGIGYT